MRFLHLLDLLQPTHEAFPTVEIRTQERPDELPCELLAHDLGADAEDVHVVVLDTLVGRVRVVAGRGADARDLAGSHRGAHARAADENAALGIASPDGRADLPGLVRI